MFTFTQPIESTSPKTGAPITVSVIKRRGEPVGWVVKGESGYALVEGKSKTVFTKADGTAFHPNYIRRAITRFFATPDPA